MIAFRVSLNGKELCTAGVRNFGVLSAIVTWVRRKPAHNRNGKTMKEKLTADIGGLDSKTNEHLKWLSRRLRIGDRLAIEVVESEGGDRPKRRYRDDPKRVEQAKRRYFARLKKEFAVGSKRGTSTMPLPSRRKTRG